MWRGRTQKEFRPFLGNEAGHWPIVATKGDATAAPDPTTIEAAAKLHLHARKMRAAWTPARRAKMARLMRQRRKNMHAAATSRAPVRPRADRRADTARFLAQFHPTRPTRAKGQRIIGAMVRYGYLKPQGNGYIRTAKAFTP